MLHSIAEIPDALNSSFTINNRVFKQVTWTYKVHRVHIPASCSNSWFQHLKRDKVFHSSSNLNLQYIFFSKINSQIISTIITKYHFYEHSQFYGENNLPEMTDILLDPCSSLAILSASSISNIPNPWCWNFVGSLALTGTTEPYTCNSRTIDTPPTNSGLWSDDTLFMLYA